MAATLKPSETIRLTREGVLFLIYLSMYLSQNWAPFICCVFRGFYCSKPSLPPLFGSSLGSLLFKVFFGLIFCCLGCRKNWLFYPGKSLSSGVSTLSSICLQKSQFVPYLIAFQNIVWNQEEANICQRLTLFSTSKIIHSVGSL